MNEGRDLLVALRAAEQALAQETLSAEAKARIAGKLAAAGDRARRRRSAALPVMALALGATAAWLIALRSPGDPTTWPAAERPAVVRAAGFSWEGTGCAATEGAASMRLDGGCRARVEDMQLSISSGRQAELIRLDDGVRLARGSAEFEVAHRDRGRPLRVWVSGGVIEVTGTRFVLEQRPDGGHVDLIEGSIRFRAADGTVTLIRPGHRFTWFDPPAPAEAPDAALPPGGPVDSDRGVTRRAPALPRRVDTQQKAAGAAMEGRRRSPSSEAAEELVEAVQALRAQRRYRAAVDLLEQSRAVEWDRRTAQILSFEEGDLLEQLDDKDAACAHWRAHQARFPGGIHDGPIRIALARLRCR
jgi:TolA-binding protein